MSRRSSANEQKASEQLREAAETRLFVTPTIESSKPSFDELSHELQVHQIELEMQNEELRQAQIALEISRDRYIDLYDFAPVGYFTFSAQGLISDVNLKGSTMLGVDRINLANSLFSQFVAQPYKSRWYNLLASMKGLPGDNDRSIDLQLFCKDGSTKYVNLNCVRVDNGDDSYVLRAAMVDISLRKQAEALMASEAFKQAILDSVSTEIAVLDHNGVIIAANAPWRRFAAEIENKAEMPIFAADVGSNYLVACRSLPTFSSGDGKDIVGGIQKVLDGGSDHFALEYAFNGSQCKRWFSINVTPLGHMEPRSVVIVHAETTEQRIAEIEQRIAAIAFESFDGVFITDASGLILRANSNFCNITGYSIEEVKGKNPSLFSSGYHDAAFYTEMWESINNTGGWKGEVWNKRKNGEIYPEYLTVSAVKDHDGRVTNYVASFTDFTERHKSLDALRVSEERLELAKRAAGFGIFDRDLVNGTLHWDSRSCELWGVDPGEGLNYERYLKGIHPDDRKARDAIVERALDPAGNGEFHAEFRVILPKDGSIRWIASTGQVIFDSGTPVRLIGVMQDITEHKNMEQWLQEQRSQREILLGQQIASQTASAIAHEINQPLAAISAYSEVALRAIENKSAASDDQLTRALIGCVDQARRAGDSLHELLNFLHKGKLTSEPHDLNNLIKGSLAFVSNDGVVGFSTILELEKDLPEVLCNHTQVQKVLVNLIRNGVEAMHDAGIPDKAVSIKIQTTSAGKMAQVSIHDNGPGLSLEAAKKIFDPFYSTKKNGIGLGLVISRSLIEANEGQLWVDSDSKTGATFHFTLPFA